MTGSGAGSRAGAGVFTSGLAVLTTVFFTFTSLFSGSGLFWFETGLMPTWIITSSLITSNRQIYCILLTSKERYTHVHQFLQQ